MKHRMIIQNMETIECCDKNLLDSFCESSKALKIRVAQIFLADLDSIFVDSFGEYKITLCDSIWNTTKPFNCRLCESCINSFLWYKLNDATMEIEELKQSLNTLKKIS